MTSVAIHVDQLFFKVPGGIGSLVRELPRALRRVEPDLEVLLFHSRFRRPPEAWMEGFSRIELQRGIRALYPSWALTGRPALPPVVRSAELVHIPAPPAVPPVAPGQRLVVHVHDLAFRLFPSMYPRPWRVLFRLGLRRAVRTADALIVPSRHTAADLMRLTGFRDDRIHVVPPGVSLPETAGDAGALLDPIGVPRPYVLFVGTLEPRKNLVRVIRAYRKAAATGLSHALVLAGPMGWKGERLQRELQASGPGRVVVTGEVSPEALDALYRDAAAFVYPSLYEGFGLPVLEAMARGAPVVTSTSSSLPEAAGDAAFLVDPLSVEDLAEAIVRVLTDDGEAERLAAAGRARAAGFTWDRTAREMAAVYRSVLRGGPAPAGTER